MSDLMYLRARRRRPVRLDYDLEPDVQSRIPRSWCFRCGREIFGAATLCDRCRRQGMSLFGLPEES